jgi:DNA-binding transcriptional LysR family regulator
MFNEFDWNDIPLVLSLARQGSMTATARELGLDTSTVSRRIAGVEAQLQQRLFIRDSKRYRLTDAGAAFLRHGDGIYGDVRGMLEAAASATDTIAGSVRISAVDFLLDHWLMPQLAGLVGSHAQLQIHLLAANHNVSFTRREADFSLRLARPQEDAALRMRRLGELGFAVFCAEAAPDVARSEWAAQPWIAYDDTLAHLPEMQWLARLAPAQQPLCVNSLNAMAQACRAGLGLALLPVMALRSGGLRRLSEQVELRRELWLLSHRDAGAIGRFKLVGTWLAERYRGDAAALCG